MRIGISQINTVPGAFDQTVKRMIAQSQRAAEQQVELLVFPLAALAGAEALPFADRPAFMHDVADAVAQLAEGLACPAIVPVPMDLDRPEGAFDALLLTDGEVRLLRTSRRISDALSHDERDVPQFEFAGMHFALALTHADLDALDDYDYDVDATLFLSGYAFAMDDPSSAMVADYENSRFADDAQDMHAWLVGVAPVGGYGDQVYVGSSFVMDPSGELVAVAPAFEEALLVADIGHVDDEIAPERLTPDVFDAPFHLWQALVLGIHDAVTKQGYSDVALCLDGSLASLVLAALASDALGPLHVHVLVGASAGAVAPACREFAHRLHVDVTSASGQPQSLDQADLDQLELAALARAHAALPLASWDKTALALGLQHAGVSVAALCPLGDVYRSDVLDMAHVRNTISPIFRRVALAEADALTLVMPDGTVRVILSEQEVTRVDEILLGYIEYDRPLSDMLADDATSAELIDGVLRAYRSSELQRRAAPPVLAMSTRTLDEARFPLATRWHDEHPDGFEEELDLRERDEGVQPAQDETHREPTGNIDLDATLAMLRDLAEQGGLVTSNIADLARGAAAAAANGKQPSPQEMMAWMTPFSEN